MPKLHIANTFFEWELETQQKLSLNEAFLQHPIFLQLQFLPVLYADPEDAIVLSDPPPSDYASSLKSLGILNPRHFILDEKIPFPDTDIESWGPSLLIAAWAKKNSLTYSIPDWNVAKKVHSKLFSFDHSPKLPGAALLYEEAQAKQWIHSFRGAKVLKTCFGVSGKGHLIIEEGSVSWERIASFLHAEWKKGFPVIAEPWVRRVLDFSTQWHIDKTGLMTYLGSTICQNDERGQYQWNEVGKEKTLFHPYYPQLTQHRQNVEPLIRTMANKGFFGNLGIDAMLYTLPENPDAILLQPVVEINARKTMGWAALAFQHRYFPEKNVRFSYTIRTGGYLPDALLLKNGKRVRFTRNLMIEVYN
jgi:hypothetical protein